MLQLEITRMKYKNVCQCEGKESPAGLLPMYAKSFWYMIPLLM